MLRISIITVSWNSAKTIEKTFNSVRSQKINSSFQLEYIVIDGDSTDETIEIIARNNDIINTIVIEKDNGIYDAMNKGIMVSTGDVVGMLNSDDFFASEDVLENIARTFDHNTIDCTYGNIDYVHRTRNNYTIRKWRDKDFRRGRMLFGWMPAHPTFYLKREIYMKYGLYKSEYGTSSDYELMIRMIWKHKIKLHFINKVMVKMLEGGASNVSFKARIYSLVNDFKVCKQYELKPALIIVMFKRLRKLPQYFC